MSGVLSLLTTATAAGLTARTFDGASPSVDFYGSIVGTGTATTTTCTVVVTGGSGSYTYAWVRISGTTSITISSATASAVTWSRVFGAVASFQNEWQCTVTDTVTGQTAIGPIDTATLERTA